ncbi:polysaccharide deacetylase family protein [Methanoculleus sp. UBA208]|uniref:polysaccharide deacetylase family protein n=1 Tax=Methanoculleus sp. UBA208 TaxID=1915494 RepID=UPI0025F12FBA|nr:polysaccharide deacetylase family protein [Methanoculleus sp. UBA208]
MTDLLRQDEEIWDLFTRKEECERRDRDGYGRFPYYRSRHRDVCVPRASQILMENGFQCEYPEGQPFAICLTHDIDTVYKPLPIKGYEIVKSLRDGDFSRAGHIIPQLRSKKRPAWNFQEIAELEDSYGACSSFYFLALEKDDRDYAYAIEDLEQEICMLHDQGWEVGLHGGCRTYCDPERLLAEKRHLEKILSRKVAGFRNHYLRFRVPDTWELLEGAGFLYDTTLGYPDCIGFRNGMCHPFRPFNLNTGREMEVLEIPLAVMDRTLLLHMRLNIEQAWDEMERVLNTVERHHGVITVLWHNEFMIGTSLQFYKKILEYGRDRGAWMTGGREIATWWEKNGLRPPGDGVTGGP